MGKKRKSNNKAADEFFNMIETIIYYFFAFNAKVLWTGLRTSSMKIIVGAVLWGIIFSLPVVWFDGHLTFLHWLSPKLFHGNLLVNLKDYGFFRNLIALTGFFTVGLIWIRGFLKTLAFTKYQNRLDGVGLKNGQGNKARVTNLYFGEHGHKIVEVRAFGIGIDKFQKAQRDLEAAFGSPIAEITQGEKIGRVHIVLGKVYFPELVTFEDLEDNLFGQEDFLIGESKEGVLRERIKRLPHMLVVGTTGGGKSVFFKQALLGLLKSSPSLQLYLIDLKGGLEFRSFAVLPNVKVVKTIEDAVAVLSGVKEEMESRFEYLEKYDKDEIAPCRDKKDRIIVGIDEASVLYSQVSRDSEDYPLIVKARTLTEHIAKLSRAAGIHLIMATQKVTKETIDTRIQENISGRMCFKLNTLEGSIRVLGNKSACELPNIPGRGIWQLGNTSTVVQAPTMSKKFLKENLEMIAEEYESGEKKLHQKMLENRSVELPHVQTNSESGVKAASFEGL